MATNFFDQFDEPKEKPVQKPAGNFFDQFDEQAQEVPVDEEPAELDSAWDFSGDRTIFGRAKESLLAVPRGAIDYTLSALQGYGATSKVRRQLEPYTRPIDFLTSPVSSLSNLVQDFGVESGQDLYGAITGKKVDTKSAAETEDAANAAVQRFASDSRKWLNEDSILKGDEKYQDLWTTQLGGAIGSFIPQIGVAARSPTAAIMMGGYSGAGTQAEKIQQARMAGIPVSAQAEAGALTAGFGVGLLENFTPFRILKALKGIPKDIPIPDKKKIFGLLQDFFKPSVIKTGVGEGTQEMTSSVLQQLIEMGYNPDAELPSGESLWNDFSLGFVAGSGAEVVTNAIESRRLQAIKKIDAERERKYREAEEANNFLMGNYLRENAELRDLAQRDPDAFNQLSLKERQAAATIEMPTPEEVVRFNEPSLVNKDPTPASMGELYAMRIVGKLRNFFPTDTTFRVNQTEGGFTVTDANGTQYGKPMADQRIASSVAANLNREVANKGIRGSILNTLMTSPEEYSKEDMDALFRYGFRALSPEANRVSFAALNEAAGTTTEKGYAEDLPLDILATAKKLRDGRYSVQMPDGSTRYIAGLTAAQKLNMERVNAGLPPATTFDINEARQALGGKIGALAEPVISGIQDVAQYGATLQNGKPVVMSDAGEVLTGRIVTDAEKARAGKDEDGNNILPDFLEFQSLDEAKRYAGRLNQRGAGSRFLPAEILLDKKDLSDDIKKMLKTKNIVSETDSPEIKQMVKAFTGAESFGDMSLDDQKLFYSRIRELPALSKPSKIPSFSERLYTPEQFLRAVKAENDAGRPLTDVEIAAATGLAPDEMGIADIRKELRRQNQSRETAARREVEEVQPLESALRKILESFKLDPNMLRLRTRLYDENGRDITDESEGYFEPALNELALAIDSIDPQGIKTEAQRIQALRGVLTHETIHILRKLDLFTQKEWSLLENAVARTKRKPKKDEPQLDETYLQRARRMYPDVSPAVQVEEAVAELARDAIGDRRVIGGKPKNLIDRIVRFFTQLRNFMDGYGFTSFQDVLRAVETGEIGGRERGQVRSLRLTEEMNAKQLGIVPARYKPFIDEFRGAAEPGQETAGAVPGEDVAAGRLPTEAAPGPDADFDIRPTGAGMRQSRRYSVKDIEKLTDSRGSLKTFAQQFGDRIKQSDRTLADADRIAKDYIKEFVENPSAFLPVVTGDKLNVDTFLRMPDGTMYDPKKLEHANATDQTIQIYNAIQNGTIGGLLQREAQALNQQRAEDLSNLAAYLNENADYSLAEQAVIMKGASKYGVRAEKEKGLKLVPIEDNNRTSVAVLTATEASAVAEELRKGKSLKDAMLDGMKNAVESMKKSNKSESFTGWKTFEKSDKEEDAAALKDGCAGRAWCTASATSTARNQLSQGDFHVYYKNGEPIVALRTVNGKLAEPPRGSLPSQFMTAEEEKIAEEALRAGRVEGGEDYLHDRDLINDVISGRHKEWSDIELFTKQKRKYPVGYGAKKYDLPELVSEAINDERLSRNTERQWEKLGYFIGNAFIQEGQNANIKYVGGNLAVDNKAYSGDSAFEKTISSIVNFDPIHELKVRGIFGGKKSTVVVEYVQGSAFVNARNTTVAIDYCDEYVDAAGESEVFVGKSRLVSATDKSFMRVGEVDKAESFGKAVIEITSEKTVKQITADNQSTIIAKNVDIADSVGFSNIKVENVNRAVVEGSSTMYAGKVNQRISVTARYSDDANGRAYIGVIEERAFLNLGYGHQSIFINEMNGGITEHDSEGSKKLYVKKFKQGSYLKKSGELFSEKVEGDLYANGTWDAVVLNVGKSANARENSAIVAGTVKEEILVSGDSAINAGYVGGTIFQQGEGIAVVDLHEPNKRIIAENKEKVSVRNPEVIKPVLPAEYFDGMSRIESAFPETERRYSRKDVKSSKDWAYSPLMKAVEQASPKITTAKQWEQWLDANASKLGVTKDEIEFSGIKDFIALKEGKVSKDDVLSYLDQNGVQVTETQLGASVDNESAIADELELYFNDESSGYDNVEFIRNSDGTITVMSDGDFVVANGMPSVVAEEYGIELDDIEGADNATRYEKYTVPGGKDYRELLLTLPSKNPPVMAYQVIGAFPREGFKTREDAQKYIDDFMSRVDASQDPDVKAMVKAQLDKFPFSIYEYQTQESLSKLYRSGHWDEPNVVAHTRIDTRTDANGEPVLFVNEIQSDWGQEGRKKGFAGIPVTGYQVMWEGRPIMTYGTKEEADAHVERAKRNDPSAPVSIKEVQTTKQLVNEISEGKVQRAPFVTDTKSWVALTIKRLLRYAVDNGFKKVAFINGEQAADLFDLRKSIESITYEPTKKGFYINVISSNDGNILSDDLTENEIEEFLGKEIVQKMKSGEGRQIASRKSEDYEDLKNIKKLSGDSLKLEHKGMKGFYDKIVPETANAVVRQIGGKGLSDAYVPTRNSYQGKQRLITVVPVEGSADKYQISGDSKLYNTYEEADMARYDIYKAESRGQTKQVAIEITPEMERNIIAGQRLFSRKDTGQPAVTQQPEARNPNLVQRTPEVLQEAVQKVEKSVADTGRYSVPLYNPKASPEALYVALNPDSGEKLDTEERRRYSRRNAPEYDPKAKAIMDRVIPQPPDETTGEFYINKMKGFDAKAALDRARANLFFQHARLERQYRENPELAKMLADTSALAMVQMADHAHQFIMSALTIGVPVYRNGMFTTDDFVHNGKKYKGLIEVMSLLRTPDGKNFEQLAHAYATAVRGERLNKEGKLTPVNPGELKVLEDEVNRFINPETGKPIVKEWFDAWQAYNSHVVKYLRDTGIVDDEGAALWLKQADYVPFYREDKNGKLLHPRVFGGMHTAGQFKAVGTSDEALNIDMLTAIQNNLNAAIAMGMRNVAQQRVVRDQINLGLGRMLNPGEEVGDRTTVSFKRKGKKQTAIIDDPLIYQAMLPISEIPMDNILGQVFRKPAELLRSFIVHDPAYMIANSMRDSVSSWAITGAKIIPGVSTVKNLAADLDNLKRLGVVGNYNLLFDKDQVRKFYAKESRKMGKFLGQDWTRPWEAVWDGLGRMNQQIDAATRVAVYEDVLKRTGNEAEAQYQALSVMNYGRRGANPFVRYVTAISPFLNTRFQGLDKLYQAAFGRVGAIYKKDAQGKTIREGNWRKNAAVFYQRAGAIVGLSIIYWTMVSDDDEYKNATPESRDNYYIIPIEKGDIETGKPGLSFRIPIPFEIGLLFKVIPERILETIFGDDTPKDLKDSFWRNLKSTLAVNWPQTILPLVEWSQNKDSYSGRPIVPTYMLNLPPEEQKNFYTNRGAVWLGEKLGMSPMKIEALGYGYGGTIGGYFLQMVDSAMRSGGEEKPGLAWHQFPVIKRFFATANQPGLQAQFYDLKDSVDGITKTVNELSEQGKYDELATFYAKNGHMYDMRSDINFLNRQITKLRDERKMVEQMDIPPESKRILIEQINMQIAAELTTVPMLRKQAFGPKPETEE